MHHPLNLSMVGAVKKRDTIHVGLAVQSHLDMLRERGYNAKKIFTDPDTVFRVLKGKYPGVVVEIGGAGDHVDRADARIRR